MPSELILGKVPSGIPGLDQVLHGGFPKGRTALICGGPGVGKTLLGLEFLALLLADRRQNLTGRVLKTAGYRLLLSFTPDHAVALCVNHDVHAVVLDQEHLVVTEDWSVAQSMKMIKPKICVILMIHGRIVRNELPAGVDAVIAEGDT